MTDELNPLKNMYGGLKKEHLVYHSPYLEQISLLEAKVKELEQLNGMIDKEREKWKAEYERAVGTLLDRDNKNIELALKNSELQKKFDAAVEVVKRWHREYFLTRKYPVKLSAEYFLKEIEESVKNK